MGDKITRCTFYRHYLLYFKKEKESLPSPPLPSPSTPKQSVLCRCPRYLRRTLRKLWLCGQRVQHCFIFPNTPHFTKVSTISLPIGRFTRLNSPLEKREEAGPSKLPKRLLGQEKMANSWPARPQLWSHKQLRDTFLFQFPSRYLSGEQLSNWPPFSMGFNGVITHAGCWENTRKACRKCGLLLSYNKFKFSMILPAQ